MTDSIIPGLFNTVVGALPSILALVKENHAKAHPEAPPLTDADVFASLANAVALSVAKDEDWKRAHPPSNDTGD